MIHINTYYWLIHNNNYLSITTKTQIHIISWDIRIVDELLQINQKTIYNKTLYNVIYNIVWKCVISQKLF